MQERSNPQQPYENADLEPFLERAAQMTQSVGDLDRRVMLLCRQAILRLKQGDLQRAEQDLREMLETARESKWGYIYELPRCAERLAIAGFVDHALTVMEAHTRLYFGGASVGRVAAAIARRGKRDLAEVILRRWLERNARNTPQIIEEAIRYAAIYGAATLAIRLIEYVPDRVDMSNALLEIVAALSEAKQLEQAMEFAQRIARRHSRTRALCHVAENAVNLHRRSLAHDATQQARSLLPTVRV